MTRRAARRVVVTCVSGRTIVGELAWSWPWCYRVRAARIADAGRDPGAGPVVDGTVVVRRAAVDFVQVI